MAKEIRQIADYQVEIVRTRGQRSIRMRANADGTLRVSCGLSVPLYQIEDFVRRNSTWAERQSEKLQNSPMAQAEFATESDKREWRAVVEPAAKLLLEKWEPIMGVQAGKLAFRSMKSRWGSCQPETGRICINTRLALYPPRCLEYVVVHELAHLLEHGHTKKFWSIVETCLPNYRETMNLLK